MLLLVKIMSCSGVVKHLCVETGNETGACYATDRSDWRENEPVCVFSSGGAAANLLPSFCPGVWGDLLRSKELLFRVMDHLKLILLWRATHAHTPTQSAAGDDPFSFTLYLFIYFFWYVFMNTVTLRAVYGWSCKMTVQLLLYGLPQQKLMLPLEILSLEAQRRCWRIVCLCVVGLRSELLLKFCGQSQK